MPLSRNLHNQPKYSRTAKARRKINPKPFLFLLILGLSVFGFYKFTQKEAEPKKENVVAKKVQEIIKKPEPKADPTPTVITIENYLAEQVGDYGYSVVELDTGESFGKRETNYFLAASTVKVGVAAYVYDGIESGRINPDTLLTYKSADYEGGTGSLQGYKIGSRFKVSFLVERMIKVSDNVATNILFRTYGRTNIQNFLNKNGLSEIVLTKNQVTPRVMTKLLAKIHKAEIISAISRDELAGYMKSSITPTRLVAGVPEPVDVAHKIGTQVQAISDIGIVYLDDKPYAIAVYSKGITSVADAESTIKYISKKVYEYENSR